MMEEDVSFSAASKGILQVHLTSTGLSVDAIRCRWIVQDMNGGSIAIGQFPDGMIIVVDRDADNLHIEFYQNLKAFMNSHNYFSRLKLEVCHRLRIREWEGHAVEVWFSDPPEYAVA